MGNEAENGQHPRRLHHGQSLGRQTREARPSPLCAKDIGRSRVPPCSPWPLPPASWPAVPALGDEFDADVSDIEATEPLHSMRRFPPSPRRPLRTRSPSSRRAIGRRRSTASLMPAIRELSPKAVAQKALGIERSARSMMRGFGKVLGRRRLPPAEVQEESSGQGSSTTWVPEGPENSWRYEDGVALGSLAAQALERQAARRRLGPHRTGPPPILWAGSGLRFPVPRPLASMCRFTRGVLTGPR